MTLAVAVKCKSGNIYRNVRPLENIKEELDASSVKYVHVPDQKMGSWEIVLVFEDPKAFEAYEKGELKAPWDLTVKEEPKIINPLKASKRAARGG